MTPAQTTMMICYPIMRQHAQQIANERQFFPLLQAVLRGRGRDMMTGRVS